MSKNTSSPTASEKDALPSGVLKRIVGGAQHDDKQSIDSNTAVEMTAGADEAGHVPPPVPQAGPVEDKASFETRSSHQDDAENGAADREAREEQSLQQALLSIFAAMKSMQVTQDALKAGRIDRDGKIESSRHDTAGESTMAAKQAELIEAKDMLDTMQAGVVESPADTPHDLDKARTAEGSAVESGGPTQEPLGKQIDAAHQALPPLETSELAIAGHDEVKDNDATSSYRGLAAAVQAPALPDTMHSPQAMVSLRAAEDDGWDKQLFTEQFVKSILIQSPKQNADLQQRLKEALAEAMVVQELPSPAAMSSPDATASIQEALRAILDARYQATFEQLQHHLAQHSDAKLGYDNATPEQRADQALDQTRLNQAMQKYNDTAKSIAQLNQRFANTVQSVLDKMNDERGTS